jgi:hypothetical protein
MGDHRVGPQPKNPAHRASEWMMRITRTAHGPWWKVEVRMHALCSLLKQSRTHFSFLNWKLYRVTGSVEALARDPTAQRGSRG